MAHEQGTFGASPKYVTVAITYLPSCYDDIAVMTGMPGMSQYHLVICTIYSFMQHISDVI